MKQKIKQFVREVGVMSVSVSFAFIITAVFIVAGVYVAKGWTEPVVAPPGGNVAAPINVGAVPQNKAGSLGISGILDVVGAIKTGSTIDATGAINTKSTINATGDICTSAGGGKCLSAMTPPSGAGVYKRAGTDYCGGTAFMCIASNMAPLVVTGGLDEYNREVLPMRYSGGVWYWSSYDNNSRCTYVLCTQ